MRNLTTAHPYRIPAILAFLAIAAILAFTTIMTVSAQAEAPDWEKAPTGLNVMAGDQAGNLEVAWDPLQPNGKTLSHYHVTWAPDGEDFKKRNQTEWHAYPTTNEVSVTGLDAGATYQVKVRARYDDNSKSDWSDVISGQAGITTNSPATVPVDWSLIPSGLSDGDQFRLMFLSSVKRDGSSSDIADYNTFIQDRAYAGHSDIKAYSDGFTVVGCTADVYARNNTATNFTSNDKGVPIYWLGGNKVVDDYEDFYDGNWDDEVNNKNESGANGHNTSQSTNHPFTGCEDDGTEAFNSALSAALGNPTGFVRTGSPGGNTGPISGTFSPPSTDNRPLYGLSAVFTVAEGTTEETVVEGDVEGTLILDTWSLVPTGLTTGDQFRLMFLSSTKRNARSSDIADYNTFVQDRAAAGHTDIQAYSDGFTVVGCTPRTSTHGTTLAPTSPAPTKASPSTG